MKERPKEKEKIAFYFLESKSKTSFVQQLHFKFGLRADEFVLMTTDEVRLYFLIFLRFEDIGSNPERNRFQSLKLKFKWRIRPTWQQRAQKLGKKIAILMGAILNIFSLRF